MRFTLMLMLVFTGIPLKEASAGLFRRASRPAVAAPKVEAVAPAVAPAQSEDDYSDLLEEVLEFSQKQETHFRKVLKKSDLTEQERELAENVVVTAGKCEMLTRRSLLGGNRSDLVNSGRSFDHLLKSIEEYYQVSKLPSSVANKIEEGLAKWRNHCKGLIELRK